MSHALRFRATSKGLGQNAEQAAAAVGKGAVALSKLIFCTLNEKNLFLQFHLVRFHKGGSRKS